MPGESKIQTISCRVSDANSVFVAGDFNNWNTHAMPLLPVRGDVWRIKIELPPGRYEYRFIIDGEWCCDPACIGCMQERQECDDCVVNQYGSMNKLLIVK